MKFKRYQPAKKSMGVGLEGHSLKLLSVLTGPIGNSITDESVHGLLSKMESDNMDQADWILAKTFRYCVDIPKLTGNFHLGYKWIGELTNKLIEFRGKYYQMPKYFDGL